MGPLPAPRSYASYYHGTPQLDAYRSQASALSVDANVCLNGQFYTTSRGETACTGEVLSTRHSMKSLQALHMEELGRAQQPIGTHDTGKRELVASLGGSSYLPERRDAQEIMGGLGHYMGQYPRYITDGWPTSML